MREKERDEKKVRRGAGSVSESGDEESGNGRRCRHRKSGKGRRGLRCGSW